MRKEQVIKVITGEIHNGSTDVLSTLNSYLDLGGTDTVEQALQNLDTAVVGELANDPNIRHILNESMTDKVISHKKTNVPGSNSSVRVQDNKRRLF